MHISAYSYWSTFQSLDFSYTIYKNLIRTSQETYYVSATKIYCSIPFTATIALYCENNMKYVDNM
jgi:hypothetical protein